MAEFTNIEPNVDKITLGSKTIYLVGTAHVSQSSAALVTKVIDEVKPDAVAVELCASRFKTIRDTERWKHIDVIKIFKEGKPYLFLTQLVLAAFQKKIADKLGIKPGAEMIAAIDAAEKNNAAIILADREVRTTLKRTWASVRYWSLIKLFLSSLWGMIKNPTIDEAEIERLKSPEALDNLLKEFAIVLPDVKKPLIDERDLYLTSKVRTGEFSTVVAVVGAGHTPGMKSAIETPIDIEELDRIPPSNVASKLLRFLFPLVFLVCICTASGSGNEGIIQQMAYLWYAYIAIGTGLGLFLTLSNPVTILVGAILSPVASLFGFGAVGWVSGLIQALLRRPTDHDKEILLQSVTSIRSASKNPASKPFLVMIVANITSTISTIWALKAILRVLANGL